MFLKIVKGLRPTTYPVPQSMITAGVPVGEPLNPFDNAIITEINYIPQKYVLVAYTIDLPNIAGSVRI